MRRIGFALVFASMFVAGCDQVAQDQSKPTQGAITVDPAAASAPTPAATQPQAMRAVDFEWNATEGSTSVGKGDAGTANLVKDGILSVVAFNNPVVKGDTVTVKAMITGPAGRKLRIIAQRHCDAVDDTDATAIELEATGSPVPVEVSHTYAKAYSCTRVSVHPVDREPVELKLEGLQFLKTAAS